MKAKPDVDAPVCVPIKSVIQAIRKKSESPSKPIIAQMAQAFNETGVFSHEPSPDHTIFSKNLEAATNGTRFHKANNTLSAKRAKKTDRPSASKPSTH